MTLVTRQELVTEINAMQEKELEYQRNFDSDWIEDVDRLLEDFSNAVTLLRLTYLTLIEEVAE